MARAKATEPVVLKDRKTLVEILQKHAKGGIITRKDVLRISKDNGFDGPAWLMNGEKFRLDRGIIDLSRIEEEDLVEGARVRTSHRVAAIQPMEPVDFTQHNPAEDAVTALAPESKQLMFRQARLITEVDNLVPRKDDTFVPFGFYRDLVTILTYGRFYPIFVTGLSGNGKTTMAEQACARLNRECIRVNITIETDEDDLIGGNTMVEGNIVYREGPVVTAMKRGALLILDEMDRGSNKLMCLQPILEGKPYYNKKTGEVIHPKPGFNIVATANTKGRGSDDGKYMAAQVLDDALLERFAITVEQEYPSPRTERKILINKMQRAGHVDEEFALKLVDWAEVIRKTFAEGGVTELVSTRRLEHIVNAYAIFRDRYKSIELCTARFDEETKASFLDLYTKVDETAKKATEEDDND